jgi:metallophosphoesterase (TIGR00282 family)
VEQFSTLLLGDIIGKAGRQALFYGLSELNKCYKPHLIIANGENADEGFGITPALADEFLGMGIHVLTSGNHIWQRSEIIPYLDSSPYLLRPLNYPSPAPGKGVTTLTINNQKVAVINVQGRVRMGHTVDCPFKSLSAALKKLHNDHYRLIFIDFHGEDIMEKEAVAMHIAGKATAMVGTHTHVPTMDERIIAGGLAFVGDLGMTGAMDGVIGGNKAISIQRALTQVPVRGEPANGIPTIWGVLVTSNPQSGQALSIQRISHELS